MGDKTNNDDARSNTCSYYERSLFRVVCFEREQTMTTYIFRNWNRMYRAANPSVLY